jgi:hypothetical protein
MQHFINAQFIKMINLTRIVPLLLVFTAFCPAAVQGKDSAIVQATAYVTSGEPINVEALAIDKELSPEKPLTLLIWQSASRRWTSLASSHAGSDSGFARVTGNRVFFTLTETLSLDPGNHYIGTTRSCTVGGICPLDVEPDAAVRVFIAR